MLRYFIKRLLQLIPVMIIISFIIFFIVELMPGDPLTAMLGDSLPNDPLEVERLRERMGLNDPFLVRYARWTGNVLTGDLGTSTYYGGEDVSTIMATRIKNSFILNFTAMIFAILIAIPVGIKSAVNKYGLFDNFFTVVVFLGISMPSFFFALLLIYFVGLNVDFIPTGRMTSILRPETVSRPVYYLDVMRHMILPVTVMTFLNLASLTRYTRNSMLEVLKQDYIRTARSKGLKEKVVIYKHAFRNALIPLITILTLWIPTLFSGAIITETVFNWPGIGRALFSGINRQDRNLVMGCLVFFALLRVLANLLADLLYGVVDPRVRY